MNPRKFLVLLILASGCIFCTHAATANAMSRSEYRAHIRSMPLLARPNRPGHFYGNTVRRLHHWRNAR